MGRVQRFLSRLAAAALLSVGVPAAALDLPEAPILRLETGMHVTRTDRVAVDRAGRIVLSSSHDKTARVWDARTGAQRQVLRLPVGAGNDGQVRAVALSPDGRTAALAGWAFYGRTEGSLFFYEVASGRMTGRIDGFPEVILDLEYSPDGRLLAVATGAAEDLAVIDVAEGRVVRWLGGYDDASYTVSWAPDGRLVSAGYDGWVRLYDADLRAVAARRLLPEGAVYGVAFSPDGRLVAAGHIGDSRVFVLDGQTLEVLHTPDVSQIRESADITSPAWTADSRTLIAGTVDGAYFGDDYLHYLRLWDDQGRGPWRDIGVGTDILLDIKMLPDDGMVVATARPELIVLDASGQTVWRRDADSPLFSAVDRSHLRVRPDGLAVGVTPLGAAALTHDIAGRRLTEAQAAFPPPLAAAGKLVWEGAETGSPRLNGAPFALWPFEQATAAAVAPDGSFGVLATAWALYVVEADTSLRYRLSVPSIPWAVSVAGEAGLIVAAYGDGTIRWHRAEDGAELLALFLHTDRTRWVAWTPSGYFDAAPGGEALIGWHVNQGLDREPVYFPVGLFRDRFYRPDVVAQVLVSRDEAQAVALANARREQTPEREASIAEALPPVVRVLSPEPGATVARGQLTLELALTVPDDAPLTDLQMRVNGWPVNAVPLDDDTPRGQAETRRYGVDLSGLRDEAAMLQVMGVNRHGFGPPVEVPLQIDAGGPAFTGRPPALYVLAVGVSEYHDSTLRLQYAAKDARDMAALLVQQEGALYREVVVRIVTDADATLQNIRDGLFWLEEQVTPSDSAKIFIAGHGVNDNRGELHFLPVDVDMGRLRATALPAEEIVRTVRYLQGRVMYFMDTCHSGNLPQVRRGAVAVDLNRHIQDLSAVESGAVVFSSAAGNEFALESDAWGNGAFTRAVLDGMRGAADLNGDGRVMLSELHGFVSDAVKRMTNNQQTPRLHLPGSMSDFAVALLD